MKPFEIILETTRFLENEIRKEFGTEKIADAIDMEHLEEALIADAIDTEDLGAKADYEWQKEKDERVSK